MENREPMSLADAVYETKYNPFKYSRHILLFYKNIHGVSNNLLLAQLIVPLCSHPEYSQKISNAVFGEKRKSTIWTIFDDRARLYDLQERLDEFKSLTEQSLNYCLINDWIRIDSETLMVSIGDKNESFNINKAPKNLGKLFSNYSVSEIYTLLGVEPR